MAQAMTPADGAAVRVQLAGLIGSLTQGVTQAGEVGDSDVLELAAHLHAAHAVAQRIEHRAKRKGVRLKRPASLA